MKRTLCALAAAYVAFSTVAAVGLAAQARPIYPYDRREFPLDGQIAACDDQSVIAAIHERFQISENYWSSGLSMQGFDKIKEIGYRTDGYDFIPRRYCEARVAFNDRKYRRVAYWIGQSQGFAGYGFGVEWCVVGLDRDSAFGEACRTAGP